jgi:uroporphyrinogen-III synthase
MTETPSGENRDEAAGAATPPPEPISEPPEPASAPPEPASEPPAPAGRRAGSGRQAIAWLAALLVLLIAGVAASPFWAPAIVPLLPWARHAAAPAPDYAALAARLAEIEKRPPSFGGPLDAIRSSAASNAQRLDRLEAAVGELSASVAAAQSALQRLAQRRDAADAQSAAAVEEVQKTRQQFARLDKLAADLGDRVGRLEARLQGELGAGRTDAALLLALLQLREAVETGRPFAAEYDGFAALARGQPDLAAAAGPLAAAAHGGVASRAALRLGLAELAERRKTAAPLPSEARWWEEALSRMRELVTVRRIGAQPSGPEAAVDRAQTALAAGDLPGAIAALGGLPGSNAEPAQQWLNAARARLAAEAALSRLQDLLTARLAAKPGVRS